MWGLGAFGGTDDDCRCEAVFEETPGQTDRPRIRLAVDGADCPGGGDLAGEPACRRTVVRELADRDADVVCTRSAGRERAYEGDAAALLVAAGRFVERAAVHDEALAARAERDPLGAAQEATGRAGPVASIAAETGLAEGTARAESYHGALRAFVAPTIARERVADRPPLGATVTDCRELDTGATVRRYATQAGTHYHLDPLWTDLDAGETATLAAAHDLLASGAVGGGDRAPTRAVRRVAGPGDPLGPLAAVLRRHTVGHGALEDLFVDPLVSDIFATAPVDRNPIRVSVGGERASTNLRMTADAAEALASRLRQASGRGFSRASPSTDAVLEPDGCGRIRVAAVGPPASDGLGFAFRRHGGDEWTLPRLVDNGTLSARAAALLSLAVERAAAGLVTGARGAGKTTLLSALLRELPDETRTIVIEDTPELPVEALADRGRDVQRLHSDPDGGRSLSPTEALRAALRLGEGALVVGEVRGEEAAVLYEAMRVGAAASAVLGTIHAESAPAVRERVVTDLGVPESSFASTDLIVTLARGESRHVAAIEEVRSDGDRTAFAPLFERTDGGLAATGEIDRGTSQLLASLAGSEEEYADVRAALSERADAFADRVAAGLTRPADVTNGVGSR